MSVDWSRWVRAGDQLVCSHMTSEPLGLLKSLADARLDIPFGVMLGVPFSNIAQALPESAGITAFGGMGSAGAMAAARPVCISLVPYSRCAQVYADGIERCDVALVSLARAPDGRLMLGASHGYIIEAARRARCVVAEINALAPCVPGAEWPDDIALDHMVETAYLPSTPAESVPSAAERKLAEQVAGLVPNGACLQVGIGSVASSVLASLHDHRHLGLHSGMLTDAMHRLIDSGVVDHSCKPRGARVATVGCVYGSEALYRFSHLNTQVSLRGPSYTHDPNVIAALPDFVALNSAIEVDLTGQANAEYVRRPDGVPRHIGGVGGLGDFMRAAPRSQRGMAIVALPSRTRKGDKGRARIVARLSGPATLAASDADIVVTEHGVARLRDRSLQDRVARMLAIADPEDREELAREARRLGVAA